MKTITIQIGNTDDRLPQWEWSDFVGAVDHAVRHWAHEVHFFGAAPNYARWQNTAWVASVEPHRVGPLQKIITEIRQNYRQESAAWTAGETDFI